METITEDYVSFETAKLLKEKGFDEPCECAYSTGGQYLLSCYKGIANRRIKNNEALDFSYSYIAPTLQMAMKWLREVHNLYIDTRININNSLYSFKIYSVGISGARAFTEYRIKSYESACEEAILYCLENLI